MILLDLKLTLGELLKNQKAKDILTEEFPNLAGSPLLRIYSNTPVTNILNMVKGKVDGGKIERIVKKLQQI